MDHREEHEGELRGELRAIEAEEVQERTQLETLKQRETEIKAELKKHPKSFTIFVNTREKAVTEDDLSFDQVVRLAFDPVPTGENVAFTITYRKARGPKPEGTLVHGKTVEIKDGTIFSVTQTDKS